MASSKQHSFLTRVLRGELPSVDDIAQLLSRGVEEDLHLEYKAGAWLDPTPGTKAPKPSSKVRRYIAGFANAEGGVLILGVAEPPGGDATQPRPLAPVTQWKSREAGERWLSDCAVAIRPVLSPPPRIHVLEVTGGYLAVVAVARSHGLVASEEDGRLVHYFRLHDKTLAVPSYLVEDLILGRRQQPVVGLGGELTIQAQVVATGTGNVVHAQMTPRMFIQNKGLVWLDCPVGGLIGPSEGTTAYRISPEIEAAFDVLPLPARYQPKLVKRGLDTSGRPNYLEPFADGYPDMPWPFVVSYPAAKAWEWGGAGFVLSRGHAPIWLQVHAELPALFRPLLTSFNPQQNVQAEIRAQLLLEGRPQLYFRPVDRPEE